MRKEFHLEKQVLSTDDFDIMEWHDCKIHSIAFDERNFKLFFDIDYIFEWVSPDEDQYYRFWISPCTLVFENVYDLDIELSYELGIIIEGIERTNPAKPHNSDYIHKDVEWIWNIETSQGEIKFKSVGFQQYTRKKPIYRKVQEIDIKERGGYSFSIDFD